ncbi:MAG: RNA methyltransferase [Erysipelotrichia bacterium]|nr:RNA methyltransferase [Erysipelotrichia bacterium]
MNLIITSKNNAKVKDACALKRKKVRLEKNLFLMEGIKNLDMALLYGRVKIIFTTIDLPFLNPEIEVHRVSDAVLDKLAFSKNPEGVVFVVAMLEPRKSKAEYHKILFLDGVNDPGNLGTMIRTATAFNYDAVILAKGSVDIYNEKVLAATKGSLFLIDTFYDDLSPYKKSHKIIVSTIEQPATPLKDLPKFDDFVLVLGNESHGVSEGSLLLADVRVNIPLNPAVDSLNVAAATSIFMHYLQ